MSMAGSKSGPTARAVGAALGLSALAGLGATMLAAEPIGAGDCDEARNGLTHIHFDTGRTDLPRESLARLERFAERAKYKDTICVLGQADAQGGDSAINREIARSRAFNVKLFLTSRGVDPQKIHVETQDSGFTLLGALAEDQPADRRVTLRYE